MSAALLSSPLFLLADQRIILLTILDVPLSEMCRHSRTAIYLLILARHHMITVTPIQYFLIFFLIYDFIELNTFSLSCR
jgi:hypothetical protein